MKNLKEAIKIYQHRTKVDRYALSRAVLFYKKTTLMYENISLKCNLLMNIFWRFIFYVEVPSIDSRFQ